METMTHLLGVMGGKRERDAGGQLVEAIAMCAARGRHMVDICAQLLPELFLQRLSSFPHPLLRVDEPSSPSLSSSLHFAQSSLSVMNSSFSLSFSSKAAKTKRPLTRHQGESSAHMEIVSSMHARQHVPSRAGGGGRRVRVLTGSFMGAMFETLMLHMWLVCEEFNAAV